MIVDFLGMYQLRTRQTPQLWQMFMRGAERAVDFIKHTEFTNHGVGAKPGAPCPWYDGIKNTANTNLPVYVSAPQQFYGTVVVVWWWNTADSINVAQGMCWVHIH